MPPQFSDHRQHIDHLVKAVLRAADPALAIERAWQSDHTDTFQLIGIGKAALRMALHLNHIAPSQISGGIVTAAPVDLQSVPTQLPFEVWPALHPLPDERNEAASRAILQLAEQAGPQDELVVLISGGGSAHLTLPLPSLTLDQLARLYQDLMRAGLDIQALNTVRQQCERLKGGGLAQAIAPAQAQVYILSDVVGDDLQFIASGPTVRPQTTAHHALDILKEAGLVAVHPEIADHLGRRAAEGEALYEAFNHVTNHLIGSNTLALNALEREAETMGFTIAGKQHDVTGEARDVGRALAQRAELLCMEAVRPLVYLIGGETTVTVAGTGLGGRNQEVALAAAIELAGQEKVALFSFATDGRDGPTDAAGAVVTGQSVQQAAERGVDLSACLRNNDSYRCLSALGALIQTGLTGTNVNDVAALLVY
ncbi:MAG: DUF4147 domain-containing protein [Chloroflexi bacterium]|nr:DUF4147 domain-containing protein [Chloroflexota bacterium]